MALCCRGHGGKMQRVRSYCENCGADATFTPLFAPKHQARQCESCGGWTYVGRLETPPEGLYDRGYFSGGEYADYDASAAAQHRNFMRKLRLLSRAGVAVGHETRVLEIGCATGVFLALLRALGVHSAVGVELSVYARERAHESGLTVLAPSAPELACTLLDLRPDLVIAWDVWEHLDRPATAIETYVKAAHPRAVVALTTVDASSVVARLRGPRWRQFHPPTHLCYPTRASFRRFFASRSMQVVDHRSFGYYRPALEYLRALGFESSGRARGALRTWPVYLNLWDTQFVVAKREP